MMGTTLRNQPYDKISNVAIFFLSLSYLSSKFSLQMQQIFAFSFNFCYSFVNNCILFFLKSIILFARAFKESKNSFYAFLTSLYIMFILHILWWKFYSHWKTWWNIFTYIFRKWLLRIIFTSINFLYQRCKIYLNIKWCLIRFMIYRLNSNILHCSVGITILQQSLFSDIFYVFQVCSLF